MWLPRLNGVASVVGLLTARCTKLPPLLLGEHAPRVLEPTILHGVEQLGKRSFYINLVRAADAN
jgi:hypothetical protein